MIEVLFSDDESPIFQKEIIFIPGNHDHRFWQNEKDTVFLERFNQGEYESGERIAYQTSDLFRSESLPSNFLNQLPLVKAKGLSFELRYPNWGLQQRNVDAPSIEELERQNGGWINFFWSSLGASPAQRDNAVLLFDIMQNPAATYQYSQRLARLVGDYLSTQVGMSPSNKIINNLTLEKLMTGIISSTLGRGFQAERASSKHALSEEGWEGLHWYLSKPLYQQILEASRHLELDEQTSPKIIETDTTFIVSVR